MCIGLCKVPKLRPSQVGSRASLLSPPLNQARSLSMLFQPLRALHRGPHLVQSLCLARNPGARLLAAKLSPVHCEAGLQCIGAIHPCVGCLRELIGYILIKSKMPAEPFYPGAPASLWATRSPAQHTWVSCYSYLT